MNFIEEPLLREYYEIVRRRNRLSGAIPLAEAVEEILGSRWATSSMLEDYILSTDSRVDRIDIEAFAAFLDVPMHWVYAKPRFLSADAIAHRKLSAMDATALLIKLEQAGLDADASPLVEHLAPPLADVTYLSESEWTVVYFEKQRHRSSICICSSASLADGDFRREKWTDDAGRRFEMHWFGERAGALHVRGARHRNPRRVETTCGYCGMRYTKGEPESALSHRIHHRSTEALLDPKPHQRFIQHLSTNPDPELVTSASPIWMHQEVYRRALRFKRDFRYDFVQWAGGGKRKNPHPESHGYLFSGDSEASLSGTIVGAAAFWQEPERWRLQWIWVCPKARRRGVLDRRWDSFQERYGDFSIDAPLSDAMAEFILKRGSARQKAAAEHAPRQDATR